MEGRNHKVKITADEIVGMLIKEWIKTIKHLEDEEDLRGLKPEVLDKVLVEFLIFYLFDIDTMLRFILSDEEHADMFSKIQLELVYKLTKRDKLLLIMDENVNKMDSRTKEYFKYIQESGVVINFQEMIDKRLKEYFSHAASVEKDGTVIAKNKAHLAFCNRIVGLIKNDPSDDDRSRVWSWSKVHLLDFQLALEQKGISITGNYL